MTTVITIVLQEAGMAVPPARTQPPMVRASSRDALVYTMRELNQQTARIMGQIEKTGKPAFITRHGRLIALIQPLAPGQVESRVLAAMAREIGKQVQSRAITHWHAPPRFLAWRAGAWPPWNPPPSSRPR